jgi:hypothetical protein
MRNRSAGIRSIVAARDAPTLPSPSRGEGAHGGTPRPQFAFVERIS